MSTEVKKMVTDHLAAYNAHDVEKMASFRMEDIVLDYVPCSASYVRQSPRNVGRGSHDRQGDPAPQVD